MPIFVASSRAISLAACTALVAFAAPLRAQGLSYDMTTSGSAADPRTGTMSTRVYSSAHGQFATGMSRLDFTQSMVPGGMMGTGTYMITNSAKQTSTSVDPAKREYLVLDMAELAKTSAELQKSLGGMAKTEITDVKVGVEDLGAGEEMEGVATYKYRITQSFTMKISVMGRDMSSASHSTTDVWIAPSLDPMMDPSTKAAGAPGGEAAELTRQLSAAYLTMRKGLMLKRISTTESGSGSRTHASTITTTITNVKRAAINPSVFQIPAGYTEVKSLAEFSGATGAAHARPPQ